ncbi:MAG TPA: hypothetical protein VK146_11155, partial [Tabrizicola sp.]|nr:hypothetical protein [Tabrizicola sp.]
TAEVDRSSILKADRFMERGPVQAADAILPARATLREVSRVFARGTQVIGFHDDRQRPVGFMRREALGNALAAADQAGLH